MSDKDCIFCKIVRGEIPKEFSYEDSEIVAFDDINPLSPVHKIIIPKRHIDDFFHSNAPVVEAISKGIKHLIDQEKLMGKGYRIVVNGGGAQDIDHLHFHLRGPLERGA